MKSSSIASVLLLLALCYTDEARSVAVPPISPSEAIQSAAAAAPDHGVEGTFLLSVKASGADKKRREMYLNSELDYRDQRNLTIEIEQSAVPGLEAKYGKDLQSFFIGKQVLVTGVARRVTISFGQPRVSAVNGRLRNKYYYQTHVRVVNAEQIVLAPQMATDQP